MRKDEAAMVARLQASVARCRAEDLSELEDQVRHWVVAFKRYVSVHVCAGVQLCVGAWARMLACLWKHQAKWTFASCVCVK